jgi:hypothetical protein
VISCNLRKLVVHRLPTKPLLGSDVVKVRFPKALVGTAASARALGPPVALRAAILAPSLTVSCGMSFYLRAGKIVAFGRT